MKCFDWQKQIKNPATLEYEDANKVVFKIKGFSKESMQLPKVIIFIRVYVLNHALK